jgi:acyl carrier protein
MGLQMVEIVLKTEHRFGVTLPDAECAKVRTVGDLGALVLSRLPAASGACPTARAFFTLRRELRKRTDAARHEIRPRTRLDALLKSGLRGHWRALRKVEPRLPRLRATDAVDKALVAALCIGVVAAAAFIAATWVRHGPLAAALALLLALVALVMLARLRQQVGWRVPPGVETVGDIARLIAPIEFARGSSDERRLTEQRVLEEIRRLTAEVLGVPLDRVCVESEFAKDLGAG